MFRRALMIAAVAVAIGGSASAATVRYTAQLNGRSAGLDTGNKSIGTFNARFNTKTRKLDYTLTFENLKFPAEVVHIMREDTGRSIAHLGGNRPVSPISGSIKLTEDDAKALQSGALSVDIHTLSMLPEIQGQIVRAGSKKVVPAPAANNGKADN